MSAAFLASLLLISLGTWLRGLDSALEASHEGNRAAYLGVWSLVLSLPGLALNMAVVPFLGAAFASVPITGGWKGVLAAWDVLIAAACVAFPFVRDPAPLITVMNVQLVITIAGSLIVLVFNLRNVGRWALRRALSAFLWISAVFLAFLVLDILVTRPGIRALAFLDGLSLPAYLLALNAGSFFFAGRFLNSDPLVEGSRLTGACKAEFGLTAREAEIVERLLDGSTNQDLADALYISRKTVENHLYNIFRKMHVRNRLQLVSILKAWRKEPWG